MFFHLTYEPIVINNCTFENYVYYLIQSETCINLTFTNNFVSLASQNSKNLIALTLQKTGGCTCSFFNVTFIFVNNTIQGINSNLLNNMIY